MSVIIRNTRTLFGLLRSSLWPSFVSISSELLESIRYYKEVINPTLEDQKYLSVLTSLKKNNNIAKIRTNSHELHSEIGHW